MNDNDSGGAWELMYQDETPLESHLERSNSLPLPVPTQDVEGQRKRMLMALGILLVALAAVLLKDWDFWFPPSPEVQEATARRKRSTSIATPVSAPTPQARDHKTAKPVAPAASEVPMATTTERAALPPLEVEVVAGNRHINVPAKSNAIHVDVDTGATSSAANAPGSATGTTTAAAGGRVELSPQTTQRLAVSVAPDYPLLARQMKVQGAVSLQTLISREGTIQEIQILSGPAILAAAAREAVKQWHFKPYLVNGQPVETQARVTVNFTISTN
ncbi:MAG: TonB family protein [Terriglobales bacterium]